jgi:ribokinase
LPAGARFAARESALTIHCFGSINIDHVHRIDRMPGPGETLADRSYCIGLGGKGANQALAAAAAGAAVRFVGAVGADGLWARDRLAAAGIATEAIAVTPGATGHAVILVEPSGENRIVLHGGANRAVTPRIVKTALEHTVPGDWWLTQNETAGVVASLAAARARGLRTAHAAAPFEAEAAAAALPFLDLIALNEGEAAALAAHLGVDLAELPVPSQLVTLGARGAVWRHRHADGRVEEIAVPGFAVTALDTTGAGDCCLGTLLAGLDAGLPPGRALHRACAAAALSVTRPGAADALPTRAQVDAFLAAHP